MKINILLILLLITNLGNAVLSVIGEWKEELVVSTIGNDSYVKSESLNQVWRPGLQYVLQIPKDANLKNFTRLRMLLENSDTYNQENTLILCTKEMKSSVEEICGENEFVILTQLIIPVKKTHYPVIIQATISKLTDKEKKEWGSCDFKLTQIDVGR